MFNRFVVAIIYISVPTYSRFLLRLNLGASTISKMEAIKLEEIIPAKPEFYLKSKNKTYRVRHFTLRDQVWLREAFPSEDLGEIFNQQDWAKIVRIVYHQLEDKSDFLMVKRQEIDDYGREVEVEVSGPEALLDAIEGIEEAAKINGVITRAILDSNPLMEKMVEAELKKKGIKLSHAGPKSSTPSRASTATRSRKSAS